ncbi:MULTISPECIES: AAA domain-containing protein [unclassified Pseudoalteromonas]|uniref:AAA domain-containing protein n=1 Tax=unclassified Pseudoalteromonas TaxID=194690 RepID=UPI0021757BD9|nr:MULTISPECIES: AAA domain-containing protein [unclassified Pseudoalteromonas]
MSSKNVLSYYRDCYKEDSADLNLWDLSKLKKQDCFVLEGRDDVGSGFLPRMPIPQEFAEPIIKRVEVYQRERVLLYVRFILVGKLEIKGEIKQVVSPILFNEALIEKDDDYYFSVIDSQPEINESLTQLLMPEAEPLDETADIQSAYFWTSLLKQSPLALNVFELLNYPELVNYAEIKKALKSKNLTLLPASMLVFVERSSSSRGVIHELEEIIASKMLSPPIDALISNDLPPNTAKSLKYDYLPGLLSAPQKKVISIAANAHLGCVSGPPGTGKSYTIAAVAAEHMARGESVLIVANNDPALDVIADKLNENFALSEVSIRAGQKEFLKNLKAYIADLLSGYLADEQEKAPAIFESELKAQNVLLNDLEQRFDKFCRKAIIRGQRLKRLEDKDIQWLSNLYLKWAQRSIKKLQNSGLL